MMLEEVSRKMKHFSLLFLLFLLLLLLLLLLFLIIIIILKIIIKNKNSLGIHHGNAAAPVHVHGRLHLVRLVERGRIGDRLHNALRGREVSALREAGRGEEADACAVEDCLQVQGLDESLEDVLVLICRLDHGGALRAEVLDSLCLEEET